SQDRPGRLPGVAQATAVRCQEIPDALTHMDASICPRKKEEMIDGNTGPARGATCRTGAARANALTGHKGLGQPIPLNPYGPMRRMPDPIRFGLAPAPRTGA